MEILQCDVDGNPPPQIWWTHENSERAIAFTPNISVNVQQMTSGRYYCHAQVPGFPQLVGSASIYIMAPPTIVSQRVQYVPDEGPVKLQCVAVSVPRATSVVWSFAGRELNFSGGSELFQRHEEYEPERVVSTLTLLSDSVSGFFGDYNCTVTNGKGTDSALIKLSTHGKFIFPPPRLPLPLLLTRPNFSCRVSVDGVVKLTPVSFPANFLKTPRQRIFISCQSV